MIKYIIALLITANCFAGIEQATWTQGADGRYYPNNLTWTLGSDGIYYATWGGGAVVLPIFTNSLHEVDLSMWQQTKAEYLFEVNNGGQTWTNFYLTNSSDYVGTSTLISNQYTYTAITNAGVTNGYPYFDGVNDFACAEESTVVTTSSTFTVQMWVKWHRVGLFNNLATSFTNISRNGRFEIGIDNSYSQTNAFVTNSISIQTGGGVDCTLENSAPPTNVWFHLTYTKQTNSQPWSKIYINGTNIPLRYTNSAGIEYVTVFNRWWFGSRLDLANDHKGNIDAFQFINGTNYSEAQIISNINATAYRYLNP
jgi:hypothetical protein